ncbi:MAG: glycerate kinase [Kiritimatiellia bacterium]
MNILVAPNSFKQCLGAVAVGRAIASGVLSAQPGAKVKIIPLADGGDGLLEACAFFMGGALVWEDTCDALARPVRAPWLKAGTTAVIELAQASGLARLKGPEEYDPLRATTAGTGRLVARALESGCRRIVIGLGGSATLDAACGMAAELGFGLADVKGRTIPPGGGGLDRLARIDASGVNKRLKEAGVICLADVRNTLLGPAGAARMFGPQKGASAAQVELLEKNLAHWAEIVGKDLGLDVLNIEGGGAAGGAGAGCAAFLGASPRSGAGWVGHAAGLEEAVRRADLVFTGEGRIDAQTACGKIPAYVGALAKKHGKPAVALGGSVEEGLDLTASGLAACLAINPPGMALEEAFRNAEKNLASAAAQVMMDKNKSSRQKSELGS